MSETREHLLSRLSRLPHRARQRRGADNRGKPFTSQFIRAAKRVGQDRSGWRDIYYHLMQRSLPALLVLLAGVYLVANGLFAVAYLLAPGSIAHARPHSFADAFFFSVQTMATVGYGAMYPGNFAGNVISTTEVVYGVLSAALSTGILFARLSRPVSRVLFSNVAVIAEHDGVPTLMIRLANQRRNQMLDARVNMVVLRTETDKRGKTMRRFRDAHLTRAHSPSLALSWTIMHPIDENSPLYNLEPMDLEKLDVYIMFSISGIDESYLQTVYAQHVYGAEDLRWQVRFRDIMGRLDDGRLTIDFRKFHDTIDDILEPKS